MASAVTVEALVEEKSWCKGVELQAEGRGKRSKILESVGDWWRRDKVHADWCLCPLCDHPLERSLLRAILLLPGDQVNLLEIPALLELFEELAPTRDESWWRGGGEAA